MAVQGEVVENGLGCLGVLGMLLATWGLTAPKMAFRLVISGSPIAFGVREFGSTPDRSVSESSLLLPGWLRVASVDRCHRTLHALDALESW